jgi:hypothetical protein
MEAKEIAYVIGCKYRDSVHIGIYDFGNWIQFEGTREEALKRAKRLTKEQGKNYYAYELKEIK